MLISSIRILLVIATQPSKRESSNGVTRVIFRSPYKTDGFDPIIGCVVDRRVKLTPPVCKVIKQCTIQGRHGSSPYE